MTGWAYANYAARLDLEENSLTRVKNVRTDRLAIDWSRERDGCRSRSGRSRCRGDVDDDVDVPCVDVVDDASNWMDFVWCFL